MKSKPRFLRLGLVLITILAAILFFVFGFGTNTHQREFELAAQVQSESQKLSDWFDARHQDEIARSPMTAATLGLSHDNSNLDDTSRLALEETIALHTAWLEELDLGFEINRLDSESQFYYSLFKNRSEILTLHLSEIDQKFMFDETYGPHLELPAFMINHHYIKSEQDAANYIERLKLFPAYFGPLMEHAERQAIEGLFLPSDKYPIMVETCKEFLELNPILRDFEVKLEHADLELSAVQQRGLINGVRDALMYEVNPSIVALIEQFNRHEQLASSNEVASDLSLSNSENAISWPRRPTTFLTKKVSIETLRERAILQLGSDFDQDSFHEQIIEHQMVPRNELENIIEAWIIATKIQRNF